ncbi:peptidyl-alpha-hydroxyglycine alpha-amidating lyase family protein [Daejeonella sp.]|uniref:peptidyl-alpha-hydroxyglycine alpha-amidating lyase family protein n=1 Tax=Daejeonella sp. TaxID=2805397 RepID=UPI003983442C
MNLKTSIFILLFMPFGLASAQQKDVAEWSLQPARKFLKQSADLNFGAVSGVAQNSKGHTFVFNRGLHPLIEFDKKGKFVRYLAEGLIKTSHGIRIDSQDNIWLTDVASHLVLKLNSKGKVQMVLGKADTPGEWDDTGKIVLFNKPSDIGFGRNGDIFITDGYGNSRVVKLNKDGQFLKAWGSKGTGEGQFNIVHAIVTDAQGLLYVADRENKRIQIFDQEGNLLKIWTHVGSPYGLYVTQEQEIFLTDGVADQILKMDLSGNIMGRYGASGKAGGQFGLPHGIIVTPAGEIIVAEILNKRVQKFVKK